ncbi:MAG: hypothetical protein KGH93_03275 [Patescibacteria group bacterium]|nr:hypothetical protein [Patescibacteria group bacterium]
MNYNTAEGTTYLNGLSRSDFAVFASDLATDWLGAWSSRFTLSAAFTASLAKIDTVKRNALIDQMNFIAMSASNTVLDVGMRIVFYQNTPPLPQQTDHYVVVIDGEWEGIVYVIHSLWIIHKVYA